MGDRVVGARPAPSRCGAGPGVWIAPWMLWGVYGTSDSGLYRGSGVAVL